jgi:hypothetical protein
MLKQSRRSHLTLIFTPVFGSIGPFDKKVEQFSVGKKTSNPIFLEIPIAEAN